jgi:hypothetical protein
MAAKRETTWTTGRGHWRCDRRPAVTAVEPATGTAGGRQRARGEGKAQVLEDSRAPGLRISERETRADHDQTVGDASSPYRTVSRLMGDADPLPV